MTEQPPSASKEALELLKQIRDWQLVAGLPTGNTWGFILPRNEATKLIDALCEQRVSAAVREYAKVLETARAFMASTDANELDAERALFDAVEALSATQAEGQP